MNVWKFAIAALVVGALSCGAANAATLALTMQLTDMSGTPIVGTDLTTEQDFKIQIYATPTPDAGDGFYGIGAAYFTIYDTSTGANVATPLQANDFGKMKVVTTPGGSGLTQIKADPIDLDTAHTLNPDVDATLDPDTDIDAYNAGYYSSGATDWQGGLIGTQTWHTTGASTTLAIYYNNGSGYWETNNFSQVDFDATTPFSVDIGPATAAATIDVFPTTPITEGAWDGPSGWLNPDRFVDIETTTSNATSWTWTLTNPNTGNSAELTTLTTEDIHLTIADILATPLGAELPAAGGIAGYNYDWQLTLTVNPTSDPLSVFVPEPTTIGLLGFGVVGALLRRRRRA